MHKQLTKHGNSLALVIDKAILDLLKIGIDTQLEITTDGRSLVLTPVDDHERGKTFEDSLKRVNRRHGKALKRLAE